LFKGNKDSVMIDKIQQIVKEVHEIADTGVIPECGKYNDKGCTCCEFDVVAEKYIGLMPGEYEFLKDGDTRDWRYIKDNQGVICDRFSKNGCAECKWKPLDCKVYPFFPAKVTTHDGYKRAAMIADFNECPLGKDASFDIYNHKSVINCAKIAVVLDQNGMGEWMYNSCKDFNSYASREIIFADVYPDGRVEVLKRDKTIKFEEI
jgi:hypothetical protein